MSKSPDGEGEPAEGELGDLLYEAYALLERKVAAALADAGFADIRASHAAAFQAAASLEEPTITSMAAAAGVTKQHMSQVVRELERLGYLVRAPSGDARKKNLKLTDRGIAAVRAAATATRETEAAWRRTLGLRAANSLVRGLRAITGAGH